MGDMNLLNVLSLSSNNFISSQVQQRINWFVHVGCLSERNDLSNIYRRETIQVFGLRHESSYQTKMRLAFIITIGSVAGLVSAAAHPVADDSMSIPNALEKRACVSNGCRCASGTPSGVYCGYCDAVISAGSGKFSDVFQCNPSGGCCDYGPRTSCAKTSGFSPCG